VATFTNGELYAPTVESEDPRRKNEGQCKSKLITLSFLLVVFFLGACSGHTSTSPSNTETPLRVALAPFQDSALITNEKQFDLEKKYGIKLQFVDVPAEELLSTLASAGQTVDVSYGCLTEYLIKSANLNRRDDDPIIFLYPLFVFRGGGFISFNPEVPEINSRTIHDRALVKKFLGYRIGSPKWTWADIMLFVLAKQVGMRFSDLHSTDIPLADGLLAAENGSLDVMAAGLPQMTECLKRHGRLVFGVDTIGFGEVIGLACKESVYKKRKKEIQAFIRLWIECANRSLSDIDHNCNPELAYLKAHASTQYTVDEFKRALALEYFPKDISEIKRELLSDSGKYSINQSTKTINQYLIDIGAIKIPISAPKPISLDEK
jgi:ABC-type nitrate/sulfonate/bicarbonate transport system substrate-binding protein